VQRDEGHVRRGLAQLRDEIVPDVDADDVVAAALQSVLDAGARAQRHLALERTAAFEDGDPHRARRRLRASRGGSARTSARAGSTSRPAGSEGAAGAAPVSVP
jgi:hypothetical protein